MRRVMIRCPATGMAIPTGLAAANASDFARTPVFIARVACRHCRGEHEWFAREAWVEGGEAMPAESDGRLRCEAA